MSNDGLTWQQRYRNRQRERGLCLFCCNPAAPGRVRCKYHLARDYVSTRNYRRNHPGHIVNRNKRIRERFLVEGRCLKCSLLLNADMDAGFVTCLNCRERHVCN